MVVDHQAQWWVQPYELLRFDGNDAGWSRPRCCDESAYVQPLLSMHGIPRRRRMRSLRPSCVYCPSCAFCLARRIGAGAWVRCVFARTSFQKRQGRALPHCQLGSWYLFRLGLGIVAGPGRLTTTTFCRNRRPTLVEQT